MYKLAAIIFGLALTAGSAAYAGQRWQNDIAILKNADGTGTFSSAFGTVRNSTNYREVLICTSDVKGHKHSATCTANDGSTYAACTTQNADLANAISKLQGDSFVQIDFDASGKCTRVQASTASSYEPKQP